MTAWQTIDAALTDLGISFGAPTTAQTTGGSHVQTSEHYQGRARDYGDATSDPRAIALALLPYAQGPGAPIDELFYTPLNLFYKNGSPITPSSSLAAEHQDHVHVGIAPGVDLAAVVESATRVPTATLASFPGSGVLGNAIGSVASSFFAPLRKVALNAVFVAGGVALLALGGLRAVRRGEP